MFLKLFCSVPVLNNTYFERIKSDNCNGPQEKDSLKKRFIL